MHDKPPEIHPSQPPPDQEYVINNLDLREAIFELEADIIDRIIYSAPLGGISGSVDIARPTIRQFMLYSCNYPTESESPARYFDCLRMVEETLRRIILRGLGYKAVAPLLDNMVDIVYGDFVEPGDKQTFSSDVGRGRVHKGMRGEFVARTDAKLRQITQGVLETFDQEKLDDITYSFKNISLLTRVFAERALDAKFGDSWRQLDPVAVANLQVEELNGQKLSRYDRHLLLKPNKPLEVSRSFGNAVATTAEFTAIGLQEMQRALADAGCFADYWYPHAFANISKLAFAAKLPFWAAQDMGVQANSATSSWLFTATPRGNGIYDIDFTNDAHQNYYRNGISGVCQGVAQPNPGYLGGKDLRSIGQFFTTISKLAVVNGVEIQQERYSGLTTSAEASTAVALAIGYKGQYNFT